MDKPVRDIEYKVFEYQSEIIRLQNEVIAGLISVVKQFNIEECELESINKKIETADTLQNKIEY